MNMRVARRGTGYALMGATVLAYLARPWSCGHTLSQFSPEKAVPYSNFDYHGIIVIVAWSSALLFAAPVLWLSRELFLNRPAALRIFGRSPSAKGTLVSVLIALGIAAPLYAQLLYLSGLPVRVAVPVILSSVAWLLLVEIGRTAAVDGGPLSEGAVRVAVVVAILATVPKLGFIGYAAIFG